MLFLFAVYGIHIFLGINPWGLNMKRKMETKQPADLLIRFAFRWFCV